MKKVLLFLVIYLSFLSSIYADDFFSSGDISKNRYYDTLGYTIGDLLESKRCPNCVEYDLEDVYGSSTLEVLGNIHIDDITQGDLDYGLIRLQNLHDHVALPPHSSVSFIYWSKNLTNEDVDILSIKVFLSRRYPELGDLRKLLYIEGIYDILSVKYFERIYRRAGIVKTYDGLGIVKEGGGILKGMLLDSAYLKSSLSFVKWEAEEVKSGILLRVYVRNETDRLLVNTKYIHQTYSDIREYRPGQEHVYEYIAKKDDSGSIGYAGIYDPNIKTECVVLGEDMDSSYLGDSAVVGGVREEGGELLSYIASRTKPFGHRFCVTLIPYTLYSGEMVLIKEEEETHESVEQDIVKDVSEEVLGIKELPRTRVD